MCATPTIYGSKMRSHPILCVIMLNILSAINLHRVRADRQALPQRYVRLLSYKRHDVFIRNKQLNEKDQLATFQQYYDRAF